MPAPAVRQVSLFRIRPFLLLFTTRTASYAANEMLAVVAGWQIYQLTQSPLQLGLVGLVQFLPPLCLSLVSGHVADYKDRRLILRCCYAIEFCVAAGLALFAGMQHPPLVLFYALLFCNALARTFEGPSLQSQLPMVVSRDLLSRAVAASSTAARISFLLGPPVAGILYVVGASFDYVVCAGLVAIAGVASSLMPAFPPSRQREEPSWRSLFEGLTFIWKTKPMLGAMSLDLTATLFGSVTALLPIFAQSILHIGPLGFGVLRSAPALGALLTAALLSRFPLGRRGGWLIFIGMGVYGVGTIIFAFSHVAVPSILLMFIIGMGDMLSGVTRQTLIQTLAPEGMRGRVLAVNSLVNDTSAQLGMFESGIAAELLGIRGSVIFGGAVVLAVTALWIRLFPALHQIDWHKQVIEHRKR